jgi:hypothetical protein
MEQLTFTDPRLIDPAARHTDPSTSHRAARKIREGNADLILAIRKVLIEGGPASSWEIAYAVEDAHGERWALDTIRTAIARVPGVERYHWDSVSPRGNRCVTYDLPTTVVDVADGRL